MAAGAMLLSLAGCGNSKSASSASSSSSTTTKAVKEVKHHSKKSSTSSEKNQSTKNDNSSSTTTTSKVAGSNYSVTSSESQGVVKKESSSTTRATMNAQDAKNIVKEHIGNQLNNAGIAGQPRPNVPTADEVDGYTTVQNGTNDWTVSGNGHTYHVTANSVTGN